MLPWSTIFSVVNWCMDEQRASKISTFNIPVVVAIEVYKMMTDPPWFVGRASKAETSRG